MLLERGAVIDAGYQRQNCTFHAALRGYTQAVQLLLEHSADVNVTMKGRPLPSSRRNKRL
jgi:hypothetical protein